MITNPFDSVKDIRRSTMSVDFVSKTPKVKRFKEEVEEIIDSEGSTIDCLHAIIGDYGSGKSHINHYLRERAILDDRVLVSYVSCKDIVERVDKKNDLYNLLLNQIISDLIENAPEDIQVFLENLYIEHSGDRDIAEIESIFEERSGMENLRRRILRRLKRDVALNKERFFNILDAIMESKHFNSKILRLVFIIDEFELFDDDHHQKALLKVRSMRDDIKKYHDIYWIFSCAGGIWKRLSRGAHADMFSKDQMTPHFIPMYNVDDRKEIVRSRMLSLIDGYRPEDRSIYDSNKMLADYCFPFSNRRIDQQLLYGEMILEMLAKPDLLPRRLIGNCYDFYGDYSKHLSAPGSMGEAFHYAEEELFKKHFFDLISKTTFTSSADHIWAILSEQYEGRMLSYEDFIELFKYLFRTYMIKASPGADHGIKSSDIHVEIVNQLVTRTLKLKHLLGPGKQKPYALMRKIENWLREKCLTWENDPNSDRQYLVFKHRNFQPEGDLPYFAELYHEFIDERTDRTAQISESDMQRHFTMLLKEERGREFSKEQYHRTLNDLMEARMITKDRERGKGYLILKRSKKDNEKYFKSDVEKVLKKPENPQEFFKVLKEDDSYIYPPIQVKDGTHYLSIETSCKGTQSITRVESIEVRFWDSIPNGCNKILGKKKFTLIFTSCSDSEIKNGGLDFNAKDDIHFTVLQPKDESGPQFLIYRPNSKRFRDMDYLTWRRLMFHYNDIIKVAKDNDYLLHINKLLEQIKNEIQHISEVITRIPAMQWDEGTVFNYRIRGFGQKKYSPFTKMISEIIKKGSISVTANNEKDLKIIADMYPWLIFKDRVLKMDKDKSKYQLNGSKVDKTIDHLTNLIKRDPIDKYTIAEKYCADIMARAEITNNAKGNEKRKVMKPIALLLDVLADAFSDTFIMSGNKICRVDQNVTIPEIDHDLISLFYSLKDNKEIMNLTIDSIAKSENLDRTNLLSDVITALRIHTEIPDKDDQNYFLIKEISQLMGEDIERFKFLQYIQAWTQTLIGELNKIICEIRSPQKTVIEEVRSVLSEFDAIRNDGTLIKDIKESFEGIINKSLIRENYEALRGTISVLEDFNLTFDKGTNKDWTNYLKEHPQFITQLFNVKDDLKKSRDELEGSKREFYKELREYIKNEIEKIMTFSKFIKENGELLHEYEDNDFTDDADQVMKELDKTIRTDLDTQIGSGHIAKIISGLSKGVNVLVAAEDIYTKIAEYCIEQIYREFDTITDNYHELTLEYSNDNISTDENFLQLKSKIQSDKENFMQRSSEALERRKELHRWSVEEPRKKGDRYRNDAQRIAKSRISPKHRKYLKETLESYKNGKLIQSLVDVNNKAGIGELLERLEFLAEMEKHGLIS